MNNPVEEWKLYEAGVEWNKNILISSDKSYYETIDANIDFANGNQWRNVEADNISKPVIPIIQKARQHMIANVCSSNISATVQPMEYTANDNE